MSSQYSIFYIMWIYNWFWITLVVLRKWNAEVLRQEWTRNFEDHIVRKKYEHSREMMKTGLSRTNGTDAKV